MTLTAPPSALHPRASVFPQQPGGLEEKYLGGSRRGSHTWERKHRGSLRMSLVLPSTSPRLLFPSSSNLICSPPPRRWLDVVVWFLPHRGGDKRVRKPTLEGDVSCHPDSALPTVWPWAKLLPSLQRSQCPPCKVGVIVSMADTSKECWVSVIPSSAQHSKEVGTVSAPSQR